MAKPFQRKKYTSEDANSWERTFGRLMTPFEKFVSNSTSSGILLIVCTIAALIIANSPFNEAYQELLHEHVRFSFGDFAIDMTLHHWINDALMAIFFYLVGLEIKHEIMVGELSSVRQAMLPICAAIGGMVVPALVFAWINYGGEGIGGWGIPMATDIAFAIAIMIMLGKRVPAALMTILVALAIVDDLGAVMVIAIFYTESINLTALFGVAIIFLLLLALNGAGVRALWLFFVLSIVLWVFMLSSGVHATIAGVLGALATPVNSVYNPKEFSRDARKLLDKFDLYRVNEADFLTSERLTGVLHTLSVGINKAQTPLQRMEHGLQAPVYFFIIPVFAFFNAGVSVNLDNLVDLVHHPVSLGVVLGLVLGKLIGVTLAVGLCVFTGLANLPLGVGFRHIIGIGLLAGIGFTMSIFIAELAYTNQAHLLGDAKIAILIASLFASVLGYIWLRFFTRVKEEELHAAL